MEREVKARQRAERARHYLRDIRESFRALDKIQLLLALAAFLTLLVLYGTLKITRESADATRKSVETAARQLELSERPWISASFQSADLSFKEKGGACLAFTTVRLNNVGNSVALDVRRRTKLIGAAYMPELIKMTRNLIERESDICADAASKPSWRGEMLFPHEERAEGRGDCGAYISQAEIDAALKDDPHRGTIHLVLLTCVEYQFSFPAAQQHEKQGLQNVWHKTMMSFLIVKAADQSTARANLNPETQHQDVTLEHWSDGDFAD